MPSQPSTSGRSEGSLRTSLSLPYSSVICYSSRSNSYVDSPLAGHATYSSITLEKLVSSATLRVVAEKWGGVQLDATLPPPASPAQKVYKAPAIRLPERPDSPQTRPTGMWVPQLRMLMKDNGSCRRRTCPAAQRAWTDHFLLTAWGPSRQLCSSRVSSYTGSSIAYRSSSIRC